MNILQSVMRHVSECDVNMFQSVMRHVSECNVNMFQSVVPTRTARTVLSSARALPTLSPATLSTAYAPARQDGKARAVRVTSTNA